MINVTHMGMGKIMRQLIIYSGTLFFSFQLMAQSITVNWQGATEPVPQLFRPGIFLVPKTVNATNDLLNNGIQCNAIRTIDIETAMNHGSVSGTVSYTHLTLPTICSV